MRLISDEYRALNAQMHEKHPLGYGAKVRTERYLEALAFKWQLGAMSILDYGCGKAVMSQYLPDVANYDPAIPEHEALPISADLVVCIDVLEHVEPQHLEEVVGHIRDLAMLGAYFVIGLTPDTKKTLPDGRNPHLVLRPPEWWLATIRHRFPFIVEGRFDGREIVVKCRR